MVAVAVAITGITFAWLLTETEVLSDLFYSNTKQPTRVAFYLSLLPLELYAPPPYKMARLTVQGVQISNVETLTFPYYQDERREIPHLWKCFCGPSSSTSARVGCMADFGKRYSRERCVNDAKHAF